MAIRPQQQIDQFNHGLRVTYQDKVPLTLLRTLAVAPSHRHHRITGCSSRLLNSLCNHTSYSRCSCNNHFRCNPNPNSSSYNHSNHNKQILISRQQTPMHLQIITSKGEDKGKDKVKVKVKGKGKVKGRVRVNSQWPPHTQCKKCLRMPLRIRTRPS